MTALYKARSLKIAERIVRRMRRTLDEYRGIYDDKDLRIKMLEQNCLFMAMLAADGPCFSNPITVAECKQLRNKILREAGLNPDGSYIPKEPTP